MTGFATEWQPPEAGDVGGMSAEELEATATKFERTAGARTAAVQRPGRALDDELVDGQDSDVDSEL
jgi:hypothetical protein